MATLSQTIELIFSGIDNVSDVAKGIKKALGDLGDGATTIAAPLADLADKILVVDAVLAGLALALGGLAFNEAVEFESAVADLNKVLGDGDGPIDQYLEAMKELALTYGVNSDALVLAMANFKQAGFEAQESADLVKNALDLVIAGDVEAAQASELLIAALKGFDAPASEAARLIDVLNEVSNNYATSVEQLAIGMAGISPIAKTMGFSMEETAGILTPVIEVFRSGDEAAVALKTGLLKLIDDSVPVQEALKAIGVAQTDANGQLRSGRDILFDVAGAFQHLDENQKLYFTAQLVGLDQSARMVKVFDELVKVNGIVATALNASGSAMKEVEIRLATAENTINRTTVAFQELAKTVGAEYKTELVGIIDATGEFAQAMDQAVANGAFDEFFDLLRPKLEAIEDTIRAMAANLPAALEGVDFSKVLASFDNLGESIGDVFAGLFGEIDLTTVEGLQVALQQVADGFAALINVTAGITTAFEPFFAAIGEAIRKFSELDAASQDEFGQVIGIAKQIIDLGPQVALALVAIGQAGVEMGKVMDVVFGGVKVLINGLQVGFDTLALKIVESLSKLAGAADSLTFGQIDGIGETKAELDLLAQAIEQNLLRNANEMKDGWDQLAGAFSDSDSKFAAAEDRLNKAADAAKNVKTASEEVKPAVEISALAMQAASEQAAAYAAEADQAAQSTAAAAEETKKSNAIWDETTGKLTDAGAAAQGWKRIIDETTGKVIGYEQVQSDLNKSLEKTAKDSEDAQKKTEAFALELEKIASNERLKNIELAVSFNIAELENETARIEAAFATIDATLKSTGEVLQSTISALADIFDSSKFSLSREQEQIFDALIGQLEQENQIRQQAADDAHDLNEALIDNLRAKTDALNRGDSLITIQADGLEPHIEAFMWEILKRIQVEANAEMQEFLLGIAPS